MTLQAFGECHPRRGRTAGPWPRDGHMALSVTGKRRRQRQPTPVFLPEESQGREPDGLPSVGLHRVGHDWWDVAAAAAAALTGKERTKTPEIFHTFVHLLCQAFTTERKTARRKRWSDRSEKQHGIAEIKHEFWETD